MKTAREFAQYLAIEMNGYWGAAEVDAIEARDAELVAQTESDWISEDIGKLAGRIIDHCTYPKTEYDEGMARMYIGAFIEADRKKIRAEVAERVKELKEALEGMMLGHDFLTGASSIAPPAGCYEKARQALSNLDAGEVRG